MKADKYAHSSDDVPLKKTPVEDARQKESRAILERMQRETIVGQGGVFSKSMGKAKHHFSAANLDDGDKIEIWSARVGRILGLVITLAAIVWLVLFLLGKTSL